MNFKPPFPRLTLLAGILLAPLIGHADFPQPRASGIETYGYTWNAPDQDMERALKHMADPARGEAAYKVCKGCHKADGAGLADADYPQLAGQHASVIIKQMMDIRAGRRDNPRMYPFSGDWIVSAEDIADIATYLNKLPAPASNGKGSGSQLNRGKALYNKDCAVCHGQAGEGEAARFYPMVAGQHYGYLKRETRESRDQGRRNANPEMVKSLQGYSEADVEAVSDYMSRLPGARP